MGRIVVPGHLRQKVNETPSQGVVAHVCHPAMQGSITRTAFQARPGIKQGSISKINDARTGHMVQG
jgi:hypothetical protein